MVHCCFIPRHFKWVSGHFFNFKAVCILPLYMYCGDGGGSPKGELETKDTVFLWLPPPGRDVAKPLIGWVRTPSPGRTAEAAGIRRDGGEGDGLDLLPSRENLLPPTAAGAQCSAGPRRGRAPPPSLPLPRSRSRLGTAVPALLLSLIKFGAYWTSYQRGWWGDGGFTLQKVGGGGIGNDTINKTTFGWADLLRCHVNKREGAFLAVILTLHVLYAVHKYTW